MGSVFWERGGGGLGWVDTLAPQLGFEALAF